MTPRNPANPTAAKASPEEQEADHWAVVNDLVPYIWPPDRPELRRRVVLASLALVAAKLVTVAVPIAYKAAVDWLTAASGGSVTHALTIVPIFLVLAYGVGRILMMVLGQIRDVLFTRVATYAVRALAARTFAHLHRLSLRFHLERRTGALSRVVERGMEAVDIILRMGVMNALPTVLELVLICGLLLYYFGFAFVVIVLVTVAAYVWFTFKASEWRLGIRRELNESDRDANAKAIDSLLNYETVKYFGNEAMEVRRYDGAMARYELANIRTYYSLGILNSGQSVIFTVGLTLCMLLSAQGVAQGTQTVGDFVMINALMIQLYIPLNFMGMVYREIKQGLVDLETMFVLLEQNPEIQDDPAAKPLEVSDGAIRFEDVSFAYDPERPILKGVSFEVPAGKMVAIVGPSGAGKSTISRILFRFYDVSGGRVTIDGQDIRSVTQASLRAAIGVVPQDTVLFNDTVRYNIAYGRPEASEAEVKEAARQAQLDAFIELLPRRLRDHGRRTRLETLGRREAARGDCAHDPEAAADPHAR